MVGCGCGEQGCEYLALGYPWCRSCSEHHRAPECAVDQHGRALAPCGHPWDADPCEVDQVRFRYDDGPRFDDPIHVLRLFRAYEVHTPPDLRI